MKLLWNEKVYGWWNVTGLIGKGANWFLGFSRKPPSPAAPIPPTKDPRTAHLRHARSVVDRGGEHG